MIQSYAGIFKEFDVYNVGNSKSTANYEETVKFNVGTLEGSKDVDWLSENTDEHQYFFTTRYLKSEYGNRRCYSTNRNDIEQKINNETDTHKIELLGDKVEKIFKRLKNIRNEGLNSRQKEMSSGNIIYKLIRRMKYLDKIWKIANKAYDNINSLKEKKYINI